MALSRSVSELGFKSTYDTPEYAIAYARFDATGVRLTSLPISCEKVYAGLQQKR